MVISFALLGSLPVNADLQAVGLMKGMAILELNGQRLTLRKGESKQGVKLIESNSKQALVNYNGTEMTLSLGVSVASGYSAPIQDTVKLYRESNGHYFTQVKINGKAVNALVDTGATTIALSSKLAKQLGINYASGRKGKSSTAGGVVDSYLLRVDKVEVGAITKYGVKVSVIEGDFPDITLLGMSFLNLLSMKEDGGVLTLKDK